MFPYEYVSFHTEKEFDHEFLRSYRINCMNFNSPKQQNEQWQEDQDSPKMILNKHSGAISQTLK